MASFTSEERAALYALFSIDEHEVREGATNKTSGKITWFTYVRREAIQTRLDALFFGEWELYFLDPHNPYTYHKDHVDCAMGLSIRGIRREYNGSQEGGGLNGAKGAATDAFKRVVSMWGIGLYLQSSPVIRTDGYKDANGVIDWKKKDKAEESAMLQVEQWLRKIGASGQGLSPAKDEMPEKQAPKQQNKPQSPDHADILDGAWNEEEMRKFWYYWTKTKQLADETILKGLGVSKLTEWTGSFEAAKTRMNEYFLSLK